MKIIWHFNRGWSACRVYCKVPRVLITFWEIDIRNQLKGKGIATVCFHEFSKLTIERTYHLVWGIGFFLCFCTCLENKGELHSFGATANMCCPQFITIMCNLKMHPTLYKWHIWCDKNIADFTEVNKMLHSLNSGECRDLKIWGGEILLSFNFDGDL